MRLISYLLVASIATTITVAQAAAGAPIWHPGRYGTLMTEHVYNNDGVNRRIEWRQHGGFRIAVDAENTYDNWYQRDRAPRVRLSIAEDLPEVAGRDFVIQAKVTIPEDHGERFHAGLYVACGSNNVVVFGPHGSTRLAFRGPNTATYWVDFDSRTCYLKLKCRPNGECVAWYSENGEHWICVGVVLVRNSFTDVGAILKTWGEPRAEQAEFAHFEVTHAENVLNTYRVNDDRYADIVNAIDFVYDLSGIEIPLHVYVRDADGVPANNFDRKMYVIHGKYDCEQWPSNCVGWPMNGYKLSDFHAEMNHPANAAIPLGNTDLLIVSPAFNYHQRHPIYRHRMQYRNLDGEEDWSLIDIHENFIREKFRAQRMSADDRFYLVGQSAGGQFVNRFVLAHPRKLEAAIVRRPGRVTFPYRYDCRYADLNWSQTTRVEGETLVRNPRLTVDLEGVKDLRFAVFCGDNDNDTYLPISQPGVASHIDGAKKWIRQLDRATGGLTHGHVLQIPGEGHPYDELSRRLTCDYFFGTGSNPVLNDWRYRYSRSDQDESIQLSSDQVPDELFHYTRFQRWRFPDGRNLGSYDLEPSGRCIVRDDEGQLANTLDWSVLRSSNGTLGLRIGTDCYHIARLHYGRIFFRSTDSRYTLEQTAFVTETFINDWVVPATFHLYEATNRDPGGPVVPGPAPDAFRLILTGSNQGDVVSATTGSTYGVANMQRWTFDPAEAVIQFESSIGRHGPQIGEWRWGYRGASRFVAGLHTLAGDWNRNHLEIQTDAAFQSDYFEQWDMGQHTWRSPTNAPDPPDVDVGDMVAYYPFDGNANDQSGHRRNARLVGGSFVSGRLGQCLLIDAAGERVETPLNINPHVLPEMSVSVWVRPQSIDGRRQVFSHDDGGFDRSLLMDNGKWTVFTGGNRLRFDVDVRADSWRHLVVIFRSTGTVLYVDGKFRSGMPAGSGPSSHNMCIGDNPFNWSERFHGRVDDLRVYDRALTIDEVWELFTMQ